MQQTSCTPKSSSCILCSRNTQFSFPLAIDAMRTEFPPTKNDRILTQQPLTQLLEAIACWSPGLRVVDDQGYFMCCDKKRVPKHAHSELSTVLFHITLRLKETQKETPPAQLVTRVIEKIQEMVERHTRQSREPWCGPVCKIAYRILCSEQVTIEQKRAAGCIGKLQTLTTTKF